MCSSDQGELRKVLVFYTGGSIGMKRNDHGVLVPAPDVFVKKIRSCPELHDPELAEVYCVRDHELITKIPTGPKVVAYQIREYHPLLDSSNVSPREWVIIAENIQENYNEFDGFVVLNGTDTLAYTSSILSYMFKNLAKPVVVTGAQISIFEDPSDAKSNILSSLVFASCSEIPEVCVYFANKLMRGNRVRKVSTSQLDAFDSPNYPVLAETGMHCKIHRQHILQKNERASFTVHISLCTSIGILYLFPTLTRTQLLSFLEPTLEGVVLITYGAGNIPSHRHDLLDVLRNAVGRGIVVMNVTQCANGSISVSYETGRCLQEIGVLPGYDMTIEAAYTKLMVVCGMVRTSEERTEIFWCAFPGYQFAGLMRLKEVETGRQLCEREDTLENLESGSLGVAVDTLYSVRMLINYFSFF